ncbi:hypothetical protein DPX16_23662 [Anabarilius grahami]|uniref:Uncharacterized protein n=1 Tax=Anabarilius grahami TaxID=495550 RepID=A0A3N0XPP3_ANAGA|nr:hypothetical protein DPX16_23662 [Anabarilius grahami]
MRILRLFLKKGAHMLQCLCGQRSEPTTTTSGETFSCACSHLSDEKRSHWPLALVSTSSVSAPLSCNFFIRCFSIRIGFWVEVKRLNDCVSMSHCDTSTVNISAWYRGRKLVKTTPTLHLALPLSSSLAFKATDPEMALPEESSLWDCLVVAEILHQG